MTLHTIDAFATPLALVDVETIATILGSPDDVTVHAVFIVHATMDEVTVIAVRAHVAVVRILGRCVHDGHARHGAMQFPQLVEERRIEGWFDTIIQRIPLVAPPFVHLVDGKRRIRVVHRNDFLARQIAGAMVEVKEIAKHQTPLPSAWRAIDRNGHTDACKKIFIDRIDVKRNRTMSAYFLHDQ